MHRITHFFIGRYDDESLADRQSIKALFFSLVAIAAASLILSFSMQSPAVKTAVLILTALSLCMILVIKAGLAKLASAVTSILVSLLFAAMPHLQAYKGEYELYLVACLECFALVVNGLIARKAWQTWATLGIGAAGLAAVLVLRVVPGSPGQASIWSTFATGLFVLVVAAFVEQGIKRRAALYLGLAEEESRRNKERLERLEAAIESGGEALGVGSAVKASAEKSERLIAELRRTVAEVEKEAGNLLENKRRLDAAHERIRDSSKAVHDRVSDQSAIVSQSSAAIEEMTASVNSISEIAAARREAIRQLKETTESGAREMGRAAEAVKAMETSASSTAEVVNVIRAVASRTNLLAMNAAIEAAHAGQAGAGFSVVADEIRKLSEETNRNVSLIKENIKGTLSAVQTAAEVNQGAQAIFLKVDEEADAVARAMDEIGRGLQEISAGSGEILQGVSESVQITATVKESALKMDETISSSTTSLESLGSSSEAVEANLGRVFERLDEIETETKAMSKSGRDNEAGLVALTGALKGVKEK